MPTKRKVILAVLIGAMLVSLITGGLQAKELSYITWGEAEWLKTAMDIRWKEFEKDHPEVKLKIVFAPWAEYNMKLFTMIAGGNPPDLGNIDCAILAKLVEYDALEPVTDMLRENPPTLGLEDFWFMDDVTMGGEIYGLQEGSYLSIWHYNKDIFSEAGIPSPTIMYRENRWNWDTFIETAKKLTVDFDGDGQFDQYGFEGFNVAIHFTQYATLVNAVEAAGGKVFDKEELPEKALLNSPEAKVGIQFLVDVMRNYNIAPPPEMLPAELGISFRSGNIAMQVGNPQAMCLYLTVLDLPFDLDVTYPPVGPGGASTFGFGCANVFLRPVKEKELAYELMLAINEPEVYKELNLITAWFPARASVISSQMFRERYPMDIDLLLDAYSRHTSYPKLPNYLEACQVIGNELQAAFMGEKTADQAAEGMTRGINELLK